MISTLGALRSTREVWGKIMVPNFAKEIAPKASFVAIIFCLMSNHFEKNAF